MLQGWQQVDYVRFLNWLQYNAADWSALQSKLQQLLSEHSDPRRKFRAFDSRKSGAVSVREFRSAARKLQLDLQPAELGALLERFQVQQPQAVLCA